MHNFPDRYVTCHVNSHTISILHLFPKEYPSFSVVNGLFAHKRMLYIIFQLYIKIQSRDAKLIREHRRKGSKNQIGSSANKRSYSSSKIKNSLTPSTRR